MAKLWAKNYELNSLLESYTVGPDYLLDLELVNADCLGSMAHTAQLVGMGILSEEELQNVKDALNDIIADEKFIIEQTQEDVHTAVENYLTEKLGDTGKKIHTGRSRNDQVIVDTRLYAKGFLLQFRESIIRLISTLKDFAGKHKSVPLVGRTHMQVAMPSSVGLWAGAIAESLCDDLKMINTAFGINDQCPLGSAASYGVPLPLDREKTSDLLGFARVQNNVLYANNSRGKIESMILQGVYQVMLTLSKMAQDLILWSMPEFKYFTLPDELCSGSSIMPQKKNPCGLELMRAKTSVVSGCLHTITDIIKGLPSGYNRDFQMTKGPFMEGIKTGHASVEVAILSIEELKVNRDICIQAFTPEVFATDRAIELVSGGMPFRDAYKEVGLNLDKLASMSPEESIEKKTHTGTTGNLNLSYIEQIVTHETEILQKQKDHFEKAITDLAGKPVSVYKRGF